MEFLENPRNSKGERSGSLDGAVLVAYAPDAWHPSTVMVAPSQMAERVDVLGQLA